MATKYLRQLLMTRLSWVEDRLIANAERNGFGDVTPAMARLFTHLASKPLGLSELARRLAVSRQAIHKLALESARLGYVEFEGSEVDARVKHLRFTAKGEAMARSAEMELLAIERTLAEHIGADTLVQLKDILSRPWSADEAQRASRPPAKRPKA
jgi:DNA-binding MarR family transcriptional regulator